jgi:hypothetical protein
MDRDVKKGHADGFRRLGVYCCGHIFRRERQVLLVSRDDGDWQFLCGDTDHPDPDEPYHVSFGVLLDYDPTLEAVSDLATDCEAERQSKDDQWTRTKCGTGLI